MNEIKRLSIVQSIDTMATMLRSSFSDALTQRVHEDAEIDHVDWVVHDHLMLEDGIRAYAELPALFVHMATRQFTIVDGVGIKPAGPDLMVGLCLRCHRERVSSAMRLGAYGIETIYDLARKMGYRPHIRGLAAEGKPDSNEWIVYGTVVCGTIAGGADDWV